MKYFGTDGIRGVVGIELDEDIAYRCGYALGSLNSGGMIILARDTRESGEWLSEAFASGVTLSGGTVVYGGILPTPAVAAATKALGAAAGAVISASHNPSHYNGIKLFDSKGNKLLKNTEERIEEIMDNIHSKRLSYGLIDNASILNCYQKFVNPSAINLSGLKIALDAANGAASGIAKKFFEKAGATLIAINDDGYGDLINYHSGAMHTEMLQKTVLDHKADLGFAFDGDADRVIAVDNMGKIVDGDGIIYILATALSKHNALKENTVVATVMTNSGIENALRAKNINLVRVSVGDHNVCAEMVKRGYTLGGEQSGHIIFSDAGTGDGILAALRLSEIVKKQGKLSSLLDVKLFPQILKNVTVLEKAIPFEALEKAKSWKKQLADNGRVLLRLSGTEPVIRIMVECENRALAELIVKDIESSLIREQ